ncbi:MAG TPA: hypothetical protein VFL42_14095 [Terriglobales bacterium]|nr:hypothetical protein [Terriglobales bacterium]
MKGFSLIVATLLLGFLGITCLLQSQEKGTPAQGKYPYDPAKQVTLTGKIQEIKDYHCAVSGTLGSHFSLKAEGETLEVHLAPVNFMKDYEIKFRAGEEAKVIGVKIEFEGKPALMARTVVVGNDTFVFRDEKGRPLW